MQGDNNIFISLDGMVDGITVHISIIPDTPSLKRDQEFNREMKIRKQHCIVLKLRRVQSKN